MATIYYWGLTGIKDSVTVALTITIDQLITAIAADESLPTDYYTISLKGNPTVNNITYGDSSTTLTQMGFVDGSQVVCGTNQVGTKEDRQIQKLTIAQVKRQAGGNTTKPYYRENNVFDRDLLPAKYVGNTATDVTADLQDSRPWTPSP